MRARLARSGIPRWVCLAALTACAPAGDPDDATQDDDCRTTANACSPGFSCVQLESGSYDCVPIGTTDPSNPGGTGTGTGSTGGTDDDGVDISNPGLYEVDPTADGGLAYVGDQFGILFDYAIRAVPDCESCRSQIVVGTDAGAMACVYDDSPGLNGATGRVEQLFDVPAVPGVYDVLWRRTDESDCEGALASFLDAANPGGSFGLLEVSHPIGPIADVVEDAPIPGGFDEHCAQVTCPDGSVALFGGGYISGDKDVVYSGQTAPDRWQQCTVGEHIDAAPVDDARLHVVCAEIPGGEFATRTASHPVFSGESASLYAACEPGEILLGGGGEWPAGWQHTVYGPGVDPGTGRPSWEVRGIAPPFGGTVTVQSFCASDVNPPTVVQAEHSLDRGGQCVEAACTGDTRVVSGGYSLGAFVFDPDNFGVKNSGAISVCGYNGQADFLDLTTYAICLPR